MAGLVPNINVGSDNVNTDERATSNNESPSELSPVERSHIGAEGPNHGLSLERHVHEPAGTSSQHQDVAKDNNDEPLQGLVSPKEPLEHPRSRPVSPALFAGPHQHARDADTSSADNAEGDHGVPVPETNSLSESAKPERMARKSLDSSDEETPSDEDDYDMDDRHYLHKSSEVKKIRASPVQTTVSNLKHYDEAGQPDLEADSHNGAWTETKKSALGATQRVPGMWSDAFDEQDADGGSERKDEGLINAMWRLVLG
ncbi:hypothetical protein G7Y79_00012g032960 [Physcia stellaris]|nr:hypothetical protein G7Y79_00012g032960 [Physcia stellaris]